ncbi:hypothetical protein [Roseicella sp. DB1501]|uniref:hypothetical protein n=1 Tax=Roseicella sp. DB1501 TaxID=2730925 RepID=UPI001490D093|nr:hypothetical protein [Roseicella sp. DB1501]NOG72893.1 hypothetical protein [Roseicella sp. DB1501]
MTQQRGEHETRRDEGGPGSSHQGGSHGRAHRERDDHGPAPDQPTNPDRSRVSGGGGERDRHHVHDPAQKR